MSVVVMILETGKRNISTNTAKFTNLVEAAATCQRNMFSDFKITINYNTKITFSV